MHYKTCEICGIRAGRKDGEKRIFMAKFPLHEERCKQWVKMTGKEDLVHVPIEKLHQLKQICGNHFLPKDFNKKKTQLKKKSIPSVGLTAEPLADELLIGFPLHVAKTITSDPKLTEPSFITRVSTEHNYCAPKIDKYTPSTSTKTSTKRKFECLTNEPKVTTTEQVAQEKRIKLSPIPSTSTTEITLASAPETTVQFAQEKRTKLSPIPSSSTTQITLASTPKTTEQFARDETKRFSPIPSTSTTEITPMIKKKLKKPTMKPGKIEPTTPRKKKLLLKLRKYKTTMKSLRKKLVQVESISSPVLKSLIESTLKNQKRKSKGRRWSKLNKIVALALYKKSPKAYRYLSHLLSMPSVRTLQSILEKMKLEPGIDPNIVTHLKSKAEKSKEEDKICVILFDEIALKRRLIYNVAADKVDGYVDLGNEGGRSEKIADHALVFMLQGIRKKFKQPIAHYFVNGTIATEKLTVIIKTVIRTMTASGYKIIATVCDQGPTNVGALNLLKKFSPVSVESNYFLLDHEKVFIIYDVPHLFKSIRNNFLQAGELLLDGKIAKWQHLINLEEKNRTTLHFSKITKLHVAPKYRSKMRVKLAAQILSNTVAAVLKLQAESLENKQESNAILQTAQVIQQLDRLFDATNGPASNKDIKKNIRQNVSKNSFHHHFWQECKQKLKTLQFLKSNSQIRLRNVRCVNGYIITISSLQDIWKIVSEKFKYLNLRQLNQDALENLFGIIRQHSPTNRNPTCHHFVSALKSSILTRLSTPKGRGSNCEQDDNEILFDFQEVIFSNPQVKSTDAIAAPATNVDDNDYPVFHIPEIESFDEDLEQIFTVKVKATDAIAAPATNIDDNDYPVFHIPETESFDEDLEQIFKTFEKQPTVYVAGYLASRILKDTNCEQCINCLKVLNPKPNSYYNYIAYREWWPDKTSLTYPTLQLCQTIDAATTTFEREVKPMIYIKDIGKFAMTVILSTADFSWLCQDHNNKMIDILLRRVTHLLIRNECGIYNRSLALSEETSADMAKKAQQQSIEK